MTTPLPRKCDKIQVAMIANSAMSATTMMTARTTLMTGPPGILVVPVLGVDLSHSILGAGRRHIIWRARQWSLRPPLPARVVDVGVVCEVPGGARDRARW